MALPYTESFTLPMHLFLAITAGCLMVTCLDLLPLLMVSALLPTLYTMFNIVPADTAFGGWLNNTTWIILGALVLADALIEIGVLKRIAFWAIGKLGYNYKSVVYGVVIAGILLSFLTSRNASWCLGAFCVGLCEAFHLGKQSKEACLIMMAGLVSTAAIGMVCYYPATVGLLSIGGASVIEGYEIGYLQLLVDNAPYLLFPFLLMFILLKVYRPKVDSDIKGYIQGEIAAMGKMSAKEKKGAVVLALIFAYVLTSSLHKQPIGYAFMIGPWLLYMPGINVCTPATLKKVNFPMVAFVAACICIGTTSSAIGLGEMLADLVAPVMSQVGSVGVIFVIWMLGFVLNFAMTPVAIYAAFAEPVAQLAYKIGLDVSVAMYTLMDGAYQLLLPYENTSYLFYYGLGYMSLKDFIKCTGIMTLLALVFHFVIIVPYWMLIGLL